MSQPASAANEPKSFTFAWTLAVLLIVAFVLGLLFFPPMYEAPEVDAAESVLFVGRFHPILLHLPIGALGLLCLLEVICLRAKGETRYGDAALLTLIVGSFGSALAVLAGIMLSREGGYAGGNFSLHQTMGIIGTAGVLLALVARITAMGRGSAELLGAYRALYFLSFAAMGLGAHFGGNLSHGSKFLTEHAPEPVKGRMIAVEKWMLSFVEQPKQDAPDPAPAPAGAEKLVFADLVQPIFAAKCNNCHGEEKQKGELRLDTYEFTMQGGENSGDKNIVPGKPEESVSMQFILLPEDDDDHMPPEGKDQLTKEESALIQWWIQQGASSTQKVDLAALPAELKATAEALLK